METVKIDTYEKFVKMAQVNNTVIIRGKAYIVIDIVSDYITPNNGTYIEVMVLKEFFTGKYVGYSYEQLRGKRVTYGYPNA